MNSSDCSSAKFRFVRWLALVALLLPTTNTFSAEDFFVYPANRLGGADGLGRFSYWVNNGWGFKVGRNGWLPVRFQFCSDQDRVSQSILGEGWFVPCLESACVQLSEAKIRVLSLGGRSIYMSATESGYSSKDGKWKGKVNDDKFLISGADGWSFTYKKGKILSAVSPEGNELRWIYRKGLPSEVRDGDESLISASYGSDQMLDEIVFREGGKIVFSAGQFPILGSQGESPLILGVRGFASGITSIGHTGGPECEFRFDVGLSEVVKQAHVMRNYRMDIVAPDNKDVVLWTPSGELIADSMGGYKRTILSGNGYLLEHSSPSGKVESYKWEPKKFIETYSDSSRVIQSQRSASGGGAYMKLKKRVITEGTEVEEIVNSLDQDGNVLRIALKRAGHTQEIIEGSSELLTVDSLGEGKFSVPLTRDGKTRLLLIENGRISRK